MTNFKSWRIGEIKVTRILEMATWVLPPQLMLKGASPSDVLAVDWLRPDFATATGEILINIQAMVIEAGAKRIMVDPCIGNDKDRGSTPISMLNNPFLDRLAAAGFTRESIDVVLCTHLHTDHVGWNTMLVDGEWVPTFPNARYLFARREFEHASTEETEEVEVLAYRDSVAPVVAAGLVDLVDSDHVITEGVRLEPSPGHTPGHCIVVISSNDEEAVITGDTIHHPLQMARPDICSVFCRDEAQAVATRRSILGRIAGTPTLLLGTHFADPTGVRVATDGAGWRVREGG